MTQAVVSLEALSSEIQQHVQRLRNAPAGATAQQAMVEVGGTVLPMIRDLVSYVATLEQAVISTTAEVVERLDAVEQDVSGQDAGTRIDPDDAGRILEFIAAAKVLAEAALASAKDPNAVRDQMQKFIAEADALTQIVEEATLMDEGEADEEGAGETEGA